MTATFSEIDPQQPMSEVLKVYPGGAHGLTDTAKDQLNADLLEFLQS